EVINLPFQRTPTNRPWHQATVVGASLFGCRLHCLPSVEVSVAPTPMATKRSFAHTTELRCSPSSPICLSVHFLPSAVSIRRPCRPPPTTVPPPNATSISVSTGLVPGTSSHFVALVENERRPRSPTPTYSLLPYASRRSMNLPPTS